MQTGKCLLLFQHCFLLSFRSLRHIGMTCSFHPQIHATSSCAFQLLDDPIHNSKGYLYASQQFRRTCPCMSQEYHFDDVLSTPICVLLSLHLEHNILAFGHIILLSLFRAHRLAKG